MRTGVVGDVENAAVAHALMTAFRDVAAAWEARAAAWLYVPRRSTILAEVLSKAGYLAATLGGRCALPIRWRSFDDYVASFPHKRRASVRTELRAPAAHGLSTSVLDGARFREQIDELAPLFANLQRKYGHDPEGAHETLEWIVTNFRDLAGAVVVSDGASPVAFHVFYRLEDVLYAYLGGQRYDPLARQTFAYFHAMFYEPIKMAIRLGVQRIEYGIGTYEAKIKRGCKVDPVSGFFHFGTEMEPAVARLLALRDAAEERRLQSYAAYRRPD